MAKARVQLRHSVTFVGRNKKHWKKNQAEVLTNEGEIAYYENQTEFVVTRMQESKKAASAGNGEATSPVRKLSKSKLHTMSKPEISDIAAKLFNLALDDDEMKKDDMVTAVMKAQG